MLAGEIQGFLLALGFNGLRDAAEICMSIAMGRKYIIFKYVNKKEIYKSLERPCQWLIKKAFSHLNTPVVNTI